MVTTRAAAALAALALTLTACGDAGGDDPQGADTSASASPESSATPSETPSASPTQTPSESEPTAPYVPGNPQNEVRPATAQESADWPACGEVWRAEGTIPGRYRGCVRDGEAVVADLIDCSFGGTMTTFDDRYYGVVGNVVNDAGESLATSREYAEDYRLCSG